MVPSRGSRNALILQFGLSLLFLSKQVAAQPPVPVVSLMKAGTQLAWWRLLTETP